MSNFGGASPGEGFFSGNSIIKEFLEVNQIDFTDMVISYSSLIKPYERKPTEVIRVAQVQVYPRIGLILAASKNLDNTFLFNNNPVGQLTSGTGYTAPGYSTNESNFSELIQNVVNFMTLGTSPFSEGITSIAAALTASILIRQLPINSDIKNIDLGNKIEEQAIVDLDRIIKLYETGRKVESSSITLPSANNSNETIYIALDIDKTTLPESLFNQVPIKEPLRLEDLDVEMTVRTLSSLSIPSTKIALGWYYISSMEGEPLIIADAEQLTQAVTQIHPTLQVNPPIEGSFFIRDGWTADEVIDTLADTFNTACLENNSLTGGALTNILASPNKGSASLANIVLVKKKLYEIDNDEHERKVLAFRMVQQVNSLTFNARRHSNIVSRELIILKFYTIDKIEYAKAVKPNLITSIAYKGNWDNITAYVAGDIVDAAGISYICVADNTGQSLTNTIYWDSLYSDSSDFINPSIRNNTSYSIPYIDGLVYGLNPSYSYLDKRGPKSITLLVQNGDVKALLKNVSSSSTSTAKQDYILDTFWFRLADGYTSVSGELRLRLSSFDPKLFPQTKKYLNNDNSLSINLNSLSVEDSLIEILKAIYPISQYTDVLAGLVSTLIQDSKICYGLQFTAFKKTKLEIKEVIDILTEIPGLEIATGRSLAIKTEFRVKPRSLIIDATSMSDSSLSNSSTYIVDNKDYGVARSVKSSHSPRIQNVYDKIDFLRRVNNRENPNHAL
ncbi:hypothetical protein H6G33_09365 [Calothrix sp. FACHB-1219]|uniref:hypothetical protein n=1 Tax=unclassified Calothrix TaxID=2619626 RepID=UPI0016859C3F|nr:MULTISPECIES: hypothetical protein [unclassified Calothrix]MBD2201554.1 hypothetical protein [Calothrix sp. FACHB-168]MBD2217240.1 hypothetical protein [Calothrix sp. FACHB-1219]